MTLGGGGSSNRPLAIEVNRRYLKIPICGKLISTKSKKIRGSRRVENTPLLSKEFPKRWDANLLRSICPSVIRSTWNGREFHQENPISLTTRIRPNGNCI